MAARLDAIGHLDGDAFEFPLTQNDMAEALGLSLVHFNKSLGALRQDGYLSVRNRRFVLRNRSGLVSMSGFRSGYLYLDRSRIEGIDAHVLKLARLQLDHAAAGGGTAPHQPLEASR